MTESARRGRASTMTIRSHFHWLTLTALMFTVLVFAFAQSMVAPALPAIQRELSVSVGAVTFVLTAFLLTASVAVPIVGRLGDMFGKRQMLLATLVVFAAGSLIATLSARADSLAWLIAGRAVQGVASGTFPLAFSSIRDEFPQQRISLAIGMISAAFGIGGGAGIALSGLVVDSLGYQWIFWFALIGAGLSMVFTYLFVPASRQKQSTRLNWVGAGLLAGGLVALLLAISQAGNWGWGSAKTISLFLAAVILLALWAVSEWYSSAPLVDMQMLRERTVLATNLAALLSGFGMFGAFVLVPQLVRAPLSAGYGFGASATVAGLYLLPLAGMVSIFGPVGGQVGARFGSRSVLISGLSAAAIAYVPLIVVHDQQWVIYIAMGVLGIGLGLAFAAMPNLIVGAVPRSQTGVATGINTIMRTIGGAFGGQVAAAILASRHLPRTHVPTESQFTLAFGAAAAGLAVAFVIALTVSNRRGCAPAE